MKQIGSMPRPRIQGQGLTRWLVRFLTLNMLVGVVSIVAVTMQILIVARCLSGGRLNGDEWASALAFSDAASAWQSMAYIATAVLFLAWIYRFYRNAHALGASLRDPPGWALAWFAIPFLNYVASLPVMMSLWRVSNAPPTGKAGIETGKSRSSGPVIIWWVCWVVSALGLAAGNIIWSGAETWELVMVASVLYLVSDIALVLAALFLSFIVKGVLAGQSAQALPSPSEQRSVTPARIMRYRPRHKVT